MKGTTPIPSATVILLSNTISGPGFKVLLLQRNSKIATHGGSWVFPGGKLDPDDYKGIVFEGAFDKLSQQVQLQVAMQAAIRESYEEAALTIKASALTYFSNWLTPASMTKRFNTFFFITEHHTEDVKIDDSEICDFCWLSPQEALQRQASGSLPLPPPTYLSLLLLSRHEDATRAITELTKEAAIFRPKLIMTENGFHSLYEEDTGYEKTSLTIETPSHRLILDNGQYQYLNSL